MENYNVEMFWNTDIVSIPYRYGTTITMKLYVLNEENMFQSLIGTVQQLFLQHFCLYYTLFFPFFNPFPSKKSVDLSFQKACKPAFLLHSFKIGEMPSRSTDFSGIFLVFLTIFSLQKVPEALILLGWRLTDFFR